MKKCYNFWLFIVTMFLSNYVIVVAQEPKLSPLAGPCEGKLGNIGFVKVPSGYHFFDSKDTAKLMEMMQNPTSGTELGTIMASDESWFAVFTYDKSGYIRDNDSKELDASAMLKSIKEGTERSNIERRKKGWEEMHILGWEVKPSYNSTTNNLEWAFRGEAGNHPVVNHNTRILGREGNMQVTLVCSPSALNTVLPNYRFVMNGYEYNQGKRYYEFKEGDKVAEYGLATLVTGGAAAVAAKSGVFKWLWKVILVAVLGIGGFIKSIFSKKN